MRSTRASGPELRPLATVKASPGMEEACDLARSEGLEPNLLIRRSVQHVRSVPGQSVAAGRSPSCVLFVSLRPGLSP